MPRPISSWSGLIDWRRLAARVCATETDSTKPISAIRKSAGASVSHSAGSKSGSDSGGRP